MALASPSLPPAADDTDDFDWEAAVREIDTACAIASTSNRQEPPHPPPAARSFPSSSSRGRQSTLDRFVDSFSNQKKAQQRTPIAESPRVYRWGDNPGGEGAAGVEIDMEAANTWIYPVNVPLRDYQFSIARTALFSNTLVALPTGLGKTLIAAVVMFNYFRWFPEGKIVFAAPSRPLVMQQIEACHNIVGIPQEWTIDMTGQMSPPKRSTLWKVKRVFFVTPQVLERDIQSGICAVKQLVCLVIDEAHRALGNYSYCVAVRELIAIPVHLRILALTATPGSKQLTIQNVIDNLCISTLEYRNEDDRDVSKYVHNRQLELIKVELTKEAVGINDLLLEAINPFVSRLVSMGVLYNKDSSTLSPCELLNSREKFRQAPPQNLPQANCGEVEGYFGILITLYHIRKLLSSHGIRPAFEMLDEKLRQGSFARSMSRNENIHRAKLLMQQSLSHGAPNPKLVKLMEVLIDHFKTKDPKDSRVIIFSNFRGSVKDIMDSLSNIGDLVKATEFIGQSSGKKLKGQSQKMQQAVLQKFRSGGYNVIVATSIGEEGLDIMEVDLVICFDANVSPLRMIQRMGRTGRKHDGRVVILACEGFELKGYLKKQASSKAIRKHMNNGGLKSFDFHPSPRMVPHICKPEVNFIELSIEQYIPRGRKVKEDSVHGSPFSRKISEEEGDLISKYFQASNTETWKPSLIAFPTFQAFPSRVHKVHHSFKTTAMLIDAMQHLQGLSFCNAKKSGLIEADTSNTSPEVLPVVDDINEKDSAYVHFVADDDPTFLQEKVYDCEGSLRDTVNCRDVLHTPDVPSKNLSGHHFLFGEDFVTLNTLGNVFIVSIPELPKKGSLASNVIGMNNAEGFQLNTENHAFSKVAGGENDRFAGQLKDTEEVQLSSKLKGFEDEEFSASKLPKCDTYKGHLSGTSVLQERDENADEVLDAARIKISATLANESRGTSKDMELSPRIAHFIEEGIVPESPVVEISQYSPQVDEMVYVRCTPEHDTFELQDNINDKKILTGETLISAILVDSPIKDGTGEPYQVSPNFTKFSGVSIKGNSNVHKKELDNLQHGMHDSETLRNMSSSPANKEIHTPLEKPLNSSGEDWQLNSDEVSRSLQQAPKYKRLRKFGDMVGNLPSKSFKDKLDSSVANTYFPATRRKSNLMDPSKGKKEKRKEHLNAFVEVEADVSQDAEVSEDEEDNEIDDKYEDSFIDDRINPTEACSHPENSGVDMMAIYRRSLLTQSPGESLTTPHNSISSRTAESGSCSSDKIYRSLETPQVYSHSAIQSTNRNSVTCQWNSEKNIQIITPGETSCTSNKFESRKRKLSFLHPAAGPTISVPPEHTFSSDQAGQLPLHPPENDDDDFFRGIDLDAVEAEATMILRCKPELSQRTVPNHEGKGDQSMNLCPPSFDLGF